MSLDMELSRTHDYWLLEASGDLDYGACAAFRVHIDHMLNEPPGAAIVDLTQLKFLDSAGLGLMLALSKEFASRGGTLVLITNSVVDGVLTLTRLEGVFCVATDTEHAQELVRMGATPRLR